MQDYQYTGMNRFGKRVNGHIQAINPQDLEQRLTALSVDLIAFKEVKPGLLASLGKRKVEKRDVIVITTQFRQLLSAGVPLMEILDDLRNTYESDAVREMLGAIYEAMEGGSLFSEALANYQKEFGTVYISLVAVGEQTGQLEKILVNLETMMKWEQTMTAKAKKVMIYPSIVALVVLGVVILMMVFVVPELVGFIQEMGGELSFATLSLISVSGFMQAYLLEILLAPFVIYFTLLAWVSRSKDFQLKLDEWVFKLSIVGPVMYNIKIARIANTLGVMYAAGVNFTEALRMSAKVAGNLYLAQNVEQAIRLIEDGMPIYKAFEQATVFPSMGLRMLKVGELSGNMDEALSNVSEYYDGEAKEMIDKIEPAIEPILTIVMAIVVGWVMMAVLGPVYDTISQVQ